MIQRSMHRPGLLALLVMLLGWGLSSSAFAQRSIPALTGPVVDEAGLLSSRAEARIRALILAHEDSTSNQLAVLTIPSLEGENLEEYSLKVARGWQLGQAETNNGVLLLVAVAERKVRIEVGYGLEGDLPDILAKRIIDRELVPRFRDGDFETGIVQGVFAILGAIEGSYTVTDSISEEDFNDALPVVLFPVVIIGSSLLSSPVTFWFFLIIFLPVTFMGARSMLPTPQAYLVPIGLFLIFVSIRIYLKRSPKWSKVMEAIKDASPGDKVPIVIGGRTFNYRIGSSSGSSSGGFSGGGGSFGGGGASGSW